MENEVVFGIVSWLPQKDRELRVERLNRLLNNIKSVFGSSNIIIIAQDWNEYKPLNDFNNHNLQIFNYGRLGIIKARHTLREKFLESGYKFLVMLDDDCIIENEVENGGKLFLEEIVKHPNGFSVIQDDTGHYKPSQLNLFVISRELYEKEPLLQVDAEKDEGFEDEIFTNYLHYKYPDNEFTTHFVTHTHFRNPNEKAPSTWAHTRKRKWDNLRANTKLCVEEFKKGNFDFGKIRERFQR